MKKLIFEFGRCWMGGIKFALSALKLKLYLRIARNLYVLMLALFLVLYMWSGGTYAVSSGDFTLNVILNDSPVREVAYDNPYVSFVTPYISPTKEVAVPFNSEYQLRIKNGHSLRATAKVYIDGALVSQLGDFVVPSSGSIDLERFLDRSLTEGKRFRFVSLDHPDVDDPSRAENGLIRVEFRLERKVDPMIMWQRGLPVWPEAHSIPIPQIDDFSLDDLTLEGELSNFTINLDNAVLDSDVTISYDGNITLSSNVVAVSNSSVQPGLRSGIQNRISSSPGPTSKWGMMSPCWS